MVARIEELGAALFSTHTTQHNTPTHRLVWCQKYDKRSSSVTAKISTKVLFFSLKFFVCMFQPEPLHQVCYLYLFFFIRNFVFG